MSKITLEDCARALSIYGSADMVNLIRAAQKVVDAARDWDYHTAWCLVYKQTQTCTCGLHACLEALTEFRKLEARTQEVLKPC